MSTIENTATSDVGMISIGRRIGEVMDEKGDAFSIRAFSTRIGMSREMLRRIIAGERPVVPSELEKIADGLGIKVERLKQMDTLKAEQELASLLQATKKSKSMLLHAHSIAKKLVDVAKGATERGKSLNNLGRAQFFLQQYDEAHTTWLLALESAKKVYEEYNESTLLHIVTANLMISYTLRKEYSNMEQMLNLVEEVFFDDPEKMGYVHYTRMKWQEYKGNYELAKKHSYLALGHFEQTYDKEQEGKALINVAHFEFLLGNYNKAAKALSSAIPILQTFDHSLLFAVKEYVKTLIRLQDFDNASAFVEQYSNLAKDYPDLRGKLQIMYTIAKGNPSYAESIMEDVSVSRSVRNLACKQLMHFYSLKGDSETAIRYYKKGCNLNGIQSDLFDEGAF